MHIWWCSLCPFIILMPQEPKKKGHLNSSPSPRMTQAVFFSVFLLFSLSGFQQKSQQLLQVFGWAEALYLKIGEGKTGWQETEKLIASPLQIERYLDICPWEWIMNQHDAIVPPMLVPGADTVPAVGQGLLDDAAYSTESKWGGQHRI